MCAVNILWQLGVCVLLPCLPPALYISTLLEALVGDSLCWGTWGPKMATTPTNPHYGYGYTCQPTLWVGVWLGFKKSYPYPYPCIPSGQTWEGIKTHAIH